MVEKTLEEIEQGIKDLRDEKKEITQKDNWLGKFGVWRAFRQLGKTYYNKAGMTGEEKKTQLRTDIESFLNERLG